MLNGKCKVWREGDVLRFEMCLNTPKGPLTISDEVEAEVDDPTALQRVHKKVKGIAGFFPTEEVVGAEALQAAEALYGQYIDRNTRDEADARIDLLNAHIAAGNDRAFDVGYALDRIVSARTEVLGASWFKKARKAVKKVGKATKKAGRFVARSPVKYAVAPWAAVPLAARALVRRARTNPAAAKKVEAVMTAAVVPALPVRDESGALAPPAVVQAVQAQAQAAAQNLRAAYQAEQRYPDAPLTDEPYAEDQAAEQPYDDQAAEQPYDEPAYADPESEDEVSGSDVLMEVYEAGVLAGDMDEEEVSGLLSFAKKVGRVIDPTKKGTPFSGMLSSIPGIGPAVQAGANLLAAAKAGSKDALDKVKAIKDLASSGVPKAKEALDNLAVAQGLTKKLEKEAADEANPGRFGNWWLPVTYRRGASVAA